MSKCRVKRDFGGVERQPAQRRRSSERTDIHAARIEARRHGTEGGFVHGVKLRAGVDARTVAAVLSAIRIMKTVGQVVTGERHIAAIFGEAREAIRRIRSGKRLARAGVDIE